MATPISQREMELWVREALIAVAIIAAPHLARDGRGEALGRFLQRLPGAYTSPSIIKLLASSHCEAGGLVEGNEVGEGGAAGRGALRLCKLVAQSTGTPDAGVQGRSRAVLDRR